MCGVFLYVVCFYVCCVSVFALFAMSVSWEHSVVLSAETIKLPLFPRSKYVKGRSINGNSSCQFGDRATGRAQKGHHAHARCHCPQGAGVSDTTRCTGCHFSPRKHLCQDSSSRGELT